MKSGKIRELAALVFVSAFLNSIDMQTAQGSIRLEPVLQGLDTPVYVTNAHDGTNRLFVIEQPGRIKALASGATSPGLFLDITARVLYGGEQGLLGLAFHPQFATNGRFFVDYTRQPDGATVIAEYHASPDPVVTAASESILLTIAQPYANHNGGMIEFGADGYLYIGMGDGGSGNDPENRAQNINELLGKILRIDVDHPLNDQQPYSSPPGNPFVGAIPGRDEIFALGLRNPFRFSFDRQTGQLYVGDVGQNLLEEVDIVTVGGNYGWRVFEGTNCTNLDPELCNPANYVPPIAQYDHSAGRCSIIGGYVYRGAGRALPGGTYVFADYCTGEIFSLENGVPTLLLDTPMNISSFGEDEAGEIYVVGLGGTVQRVSPVTPTTTTMLTSSPNPSLVGATVTFTATVTGTNPSGSVNFTDGGASIATCAAVMLSGAGNIRTAACSTNSLSAGVHSIVANYSGDPGNAASASAPLSQGVNAANAAFSNGGFEAPNLAGSYQYLPSGATWVFTGGAGITGNGNAFTSGNGPAPEGSQAAFLQGTGMVAQTVNLAAGAYTVSFQAAQRGNFQSGTQIVRVQLDGVTVGQYQPPNTAYTNYTTPSFTVASSGNHTITLVGVGSGADFTAFIDDVRLAAASTPAAFSNGGFEAPNLAGSYQYLPSGATWVFTGGAGITGNGNAFTSGNGPAPEGSQAAFLQGTGMVAQTVNLAAGAYTVSFQAAQRGNFQSGTQIVRVQLDGVTVGQYQPPNTAYTNYTTPSFTVASSGNHTITLVGVGSGADFTAFIDDVRLAAASTPAAFSNGGFEAPNLAGSYQYLPSGATWVFTGGAGITGNGNAFTSGNGPAPEGSQAAFLQGTGMVAQTVNLAAGAYTVSFQAAQRGNFQSGTQIVRVQLDGVTVGQYQPPNTAYTNYTTPSFTVASSGNHTITLVGVGSGADFTAFIDDVRLQ